MPEYVQQLFIRWRIEELVVKYPRLRLIPAPEGVVILSGALAFDAEAPGMKRIADEYQVKLSIPHSFPDKIPSVLETGGRIPWHFHKFTDGALCLGSRTRLRLIVSEWPTLLDFVERCVIPYLYGYSHFARHGTLPFGELKHGDQGIRQDFASIFGVDQESSVPEFVRLTSMRKRHANKQPCPCGSMRRLGRCHHRRLNMLRERLGRHWFRREHEALREHSVQTHQTLPHLQAEPCFEFSR